MKQPVMELATLFNQGANLERVCDWHGAKRIYLDILKIDKRNTKALTLLGIVSLQSNQREDALDYFEKALKILPNDAGMLNNLAGFWLHENRPDKAESYALRSLQINNGSFETLKILFKTYYRLGKVKKAQQYILRALDLAPDSVEFKTDLAQLYDTGGEPEKAKAIYEGLLRASVESVYVYDGLVRIQTYREEPDIYCQMTKQILEPMASPDDKIWLHCALAKLDDDLGRYSQAFAHLLAAKAPANAAAQVKNSRRHLALIKQYVTQAYFQGKQTWGFNSDRPVFIFGMPRSGTTLVEQILASHPEVHGANELSFFRDIARRMDLDQVDENKFLVALGQLKRKTVKEMAQEYLRLLLAYSSTAKRVVDKMPHNFEVLWLLALAFPKARFIHCRRDPMATCVSCFIQPLAGQHAYAEDLFALGDYYRLYREMMNHWLAILPVNILEVQYEQLVTNPEVEIRKLVAHTGLPWHDGCLSFHEARRDVRTPSRRQVERPVYTSALDSWRRYEPFLAPLKEGLGDLMRSA